MRYSSHNELRQLQPGSGAFLLEKLTEILVVLRSNEEGEWRSLLCENILDGDIQLGRTLNREGCSLERWKQKGQQGNESDLKWAA